MKRLALPIVVLLAGCPIDPSALPPMTFDVAEADFWKAPPRPPGPAPGEGRVYVTNNLDDTVSILDLGSLERGAPEVITTVPVGFVPVEREGPHHLTVDPTGEFFFVGISNFVPGSGSGPHGVHGSGSAEGHLMKYRASDYSFVSSVRIDRNPGDVRLTNDGTKLLASHFDLLKITEAVAQGIESGPELDARLAIVDAATMEREAFVDACPAPHGIGVTADDRKAVISCLSDEVAIVDLVEHTTVRVPVLAEPGGALEPICNPYAVTIDGGTAWASCYNTGELIAIDIESGTRAGKTFQLLGAAAFGHAVDGKLVVAHQQTDGITIIDTAGPTQLSQKLLFPDVCALPHVARFSDDGTKIFVVCEGNRQSPGTMVVLDAQPPHDILGSAPLGRFPDDIAIARSAP